MDLFIIATREKYRFPFRGLISIEDLWDLDIKQLDEVYQALSKKCDQNKTCSLIRQSDNKNKYTENCMEIVKYIFDYKIKKAQDNAANAEKAQKRQHIMQILAEKQDENIRNMSEDELKKLLEEM